jgi:hypothetical protein
MPVASQKRRRKPTVVEVREGLARSGDVAELLRLLTTTSPALLDLEATFKLLLVAIEVASRRDPGRFASDVFSHIVGFTGYLLLRTHMRAGALISIYDRSGRGVAELPRELTEHLLPQLLRLQEHLAEMMALQATTARSWALTRQKEIENGRAAGSEGQSGHGAARQVNSSAVAPPPGVAEPAMTSSKGKEWHGAMKEESHDAAEDVQGPGQNQRLPPAGKVAASAAADGGGSSFSAEARSHCPQEGRQSAGVGPAISPPGEWSAQVEIHPSLP